MMRVLSILLLVLEINLALCTSNTRPIPLMFHAHPYINGLQSTQPTNLAFISNHQLQCSTIDNTTQGTQEIMEFKESYTPQFTNLPKRSLVDNDSDDFPQLPHQNPISRTSTFDINIAAIIQERHKPESPLQSTCPSFFANQPNLDKQAISPSLIMPDTMPLYASNTSLEALDCVASRAITDTKAKSQATPSPVISKMYLSRTNSETSNLVILSDFEVCVYWDDGVATLQQPDIFEEVDLIGMNANRLEQDKERKIGNNNMTAITQSVETIDSDPNVDTDHLKGLLYVIYQYGDDPSRSTLENSDYMYKNDDKSEEDMETGSNQFHSSLDKNDKDEYGVGSIQCHSNGEEDHKLSDGKGVMKMHPDVENNEDLFGDDTQNGIYNDKYDDDGPGGGDDIVNDENRGTYKTLAIIMFVFLCFGDSLREDRFNVFIIFLLSIPTTARSQSWAASGSSIYHHTTVSTISKIRKKLSNVPILAWILIGICVIVIAIYCIYRFRKWKRKKSKQEPAIIPAAIAMSNLKNQETQQNNAQYQPNMSFVIVQNQLNQDQMNPPPPHDNEEKTNETDQWLNKVNQIYQDNKNAIETRNSHGMNITNKDKEILEKEDVNITQMTRHIMTNEGFTHNLLQQQYTKDVIAKLIDKGWPDDQQLIGAYLSFIFHAVSRFDTREFYQTPSNYATPMPSTQDPNTQNDGEESRQTDVSIIGVYDDDEGATRK